MSEEKRLSSCFKNLIPTNAALEISSSGPSGEYRGYRFGLYELVIGEELGQYLSGISSASVSVIESGALPQYYFQYYSSATSIRRSTRETAKTHNCAHNRHFPFENSAECFENCTPLQLQCIHGR